MSAGRRPFRITSLVMGLLSVPLAFARHLVSLALVLAVLSLLLNGTGALLRRGSGSRTTRLAGWSAVLGLVSSLVMWGLWASGVLLRRHSPRSTHDHASAQASRGASRPMESGSLTLTWPSQSRRQAA